MKTAVYCALLTLFSTIAYAEQKTYRKDIRPLWEARCAMCHGVNSPYVGEFKEDKQRFIAHSQGPRMDTYADLVSFVSWPDTGAIMRRLDDGKNTPDGKPGNMYGHLGTNEAERQKNLALFKEWLGKDAWTLKRRADITKEELDRIVAAY